MTFQESSNVNDEEVMSDQEEEEEKEGEEVGELRVEVLEQSINNESEQTETA